MTTKITQLLLSLELVLVPVFSVSVQAETDILPPTLVINELQLNGVGSGTTAHEFIELVNVSGEPIDIGGWKLRYISSTGNLDTAKFFVTFASPQIVAPDGYVLVAPDTFLPEISPKTTYAITSSFSGLAATGGTAVLTNSLGIAIDTVGWGTKTTTICETALATAPADGKSIQRKVVDGTAQDTDNNALDFIAADNPSPEAQNLVLPELPTPDPDEDTQPEIPTESSPNDTEPSESPEQTESPISDVADDSTIDTQPGDATLQLESTPDAYVQVLLNELYIDPASPLSDAADEWIELYNPTDTAENLKGYAVYAGETYAYRHAFTTDTIIPPYGYYVIGSDTTAIALANGGGAAKVVDPSGSIADSVTYDKARTGESWAKDATGIWRWTTTITEGEQNSITEPIAASVIASASATKKATTSKAKVTKPATNAKKATSKATAAKITKVKSATTSSSYEPATVPAPSPIPLWLLAILGVLAVLYSGYEYRYDIANKVYQFRRYRAARQKNRR